jgi:hypothetical protein
MWHVWRRGELRTGFWWKNLRKISYFEGLGIRGRIILKCVFNKQNREEWQALLNAVINLWFYKMRGIP